MKKSVAYLTPFIEDEKQGGGKTSAGKILLATVKGDVHDIGKNIVGVVLGCNNYEVVDLGVMVPPEKILETARKENVDVIGLSGLITPSLDEMVHVASEMERLGFEKPLLIGGATTSKIHTAVKIEPAYHKGATVHVLDASRSVTVVESLLGNKKQGFLERLRQEYQEIRERHERTREAKNYLGIEQARANKLKVDTTNTTVVRPQKLGIQVFEDYDLKEISCYIDWTPFFQTWELHGRFPHILKDDVVGEQATELYRDAVEMMEKIITEKWLTAKAVIGLFPANSVGDDVEIYADENRSQILAVNHNLRQQNQKAAGQPNFCLSDFVLPKESNQIDYMGGFAVTTGIGIESHLKRFEEQHDDYSSIMLKALADRLAEALAELMHARVRKEFWGYVPDELLDNESLIKEKYVGIRPAPGYPACPDHTEKRTLFNLLEVSKNTGIILTESLAMFPTAAVSGWYFGSPESRYFGLGKISKDQVEDYAARKNMSVGEIERWLRPVLNY